MMGARGVARGAIHLVTFGATAGLMVAGSRVSANIVLGMLVGLALFGIGASLMRPRSALGPWMLRIGRTALFGCLLGMLVASWR